MSEVVLLRDDYCAAPSSLPPPVKKRKSFTNVSRQMQHIKTDQILEVLNNFIDCEKENDDECELTVTQLLGFLIYRINYVNNREVANLGLSIFEQKVSEKPSFDNLDAISLMHDLTLTKTQMRNVKSYLKQKDDYSPNTTDLLQPRKELKPVIHMELDGDGVSVDYKELIKMTSTSLINAVKMNEMAELDPSKPLMAVYKDGCDGAGSQSTWNSRSMINASDHMFQYSIVPLRLEQDSKVLWKNPTPNAATSTRPIYLFRASEDDPAVLNLVIPVTDKARGELMSSHIPISDNEGNVYNVSHVIHDTMKDLKLKKIWSGLGGADCIICEARKPDLMDPEKICHGFPITRNANSSLELYERLIFEGDGEIIRKPNDYNSRKGLTNIPLTSSDQHSITILHSFINVLGWFLKLLYRCHASYETWLERKTVIGEPIRRAKERVLTIIKNATGMTLDQVSGANDKSGTSNDGNQARRFFSQESSLVILSCVDDKYKETIKELHRNLTVILRVVSSSNEIDCEKLHQLTLQTSLLLAEKLPWVSINYTLHGLLHHSVEQIQLNSSYSLGSLSEEALESNNNFVRRYLEQFSRKICPTEQLKDAFSRLLERSDPVIIFHQRRFKNLQFCTVCNCSHHLTKNHDKYSDKMEKSKVVNEYDSMISGILTQDNIYVAVFINNI